MSIAFVATGTRSSGKRRAVWVTRATVLLLAATVPGARAEDRHTTTIENYAALLAMAQTASDRCEDLLVNQSLLLQLPTVFGIGPADEPMARFAVSLEMLRLSDMIARAPHLKAWCDAALSAYGPTGTIVPNLLSRDPAPDDPPAKP